MSRSDWFEGLGLETQVLALDDDDIDEDDEIDDEDWDDDDDWEDDDWDDDDDLW